MKYITEEISGKGKTRHMFAMGKSEAIILKALVANALTHMPRTLQTQNTISRLRNISREFKMALPKLPPSDADNYNLP